MQTFTDNSRRAWSITIDDEAIARVRDGVGIDLAGDLEVVMARLSTDAAALAGTVYALCEPEVEKRGVSPEAFAKALTGWAIDRAGKAILAEIRSLIPAEQQQVINSRLMKGR